jgi:hypothetical protein
MTHSFPGGSAPEKQSALTEPPSEFVVQMVGFVGTLYPSAEVRSPQIIENAMSGTGGEVEASLVKRVLRAIADAHPEEGSFAVTRVDISRGWGDLVNVTLHARQDTARGPGHARDVRQAVERALGTERFRVRFQETG